MSGLGNSYINLAPGNPSGLPYELQLAQLQRQQRLADQLRQEADAPIPVQQGGGAPAPISWGSILGKVLNNVSAGMKERRAQEQYQQLGQQDSDSARALAAQLTKQSPALPPVQTQIDGTLPTLPGQAPQPQGPQVQAQVGGQAPQGPSMQDQLAAILSAHGGPQTQMIQNAMLPNILQRQNLDYQHQLGREDDAWKLAQPMGLAAKQQIAAQGAQTQANEAAQNALPMTAAQQATYGIEQGKLAEERNYHQMLTGAGIGGDDPNVKNWVAAVASGNVPGIQSVPKRYQTAVAGAINNAPQAIFAPIASRRFGMASNSIVGPLMKLPQYELTAQGLPYIQRIQSALTKPGSVSDQELLDSFTKLSTSGNAITDAQVRIITDGKSLSDWASTLQQRLGGGGVLSTDQRKQIAEIANRTYAKYKEGYEPLYKEATDKLTAAGIPKPFWTIPDLNKLNAAQTGGAVAPPPGANIAPAGTKATGPGGKTLTSDGKGGWN